MIGLVPKMLIDFLESQLDRETVASIKENAGIPLERKYSMSVYYSEDEWQRLFQSACETLHLSREEAESIFADYFYRDALQRWPRWFEMSTNSFEFMKRQPAIHNILASSCPGRQISQSVKDKFEMKWKTASVDVKYKSPNLHCGFFNSMAKNIANHYGDQIAIQETHCMKSGAESCQIRVDWIINGENSL